ncbi:hypothetical protein F7734_13185 [Scytonema sp. UIC 10036]|nr:hypothetical protein [Scytonema sp. UIC 10036]MUG93329.1 hypothetical protein [Scytonema sp. UIC 10036]
MALSPRQIIVWVTGILAIAVTLDGRVAVTASRDSTLNVWNLEDKTEF